MSTMERWYLECLLIWTHHKGRSPMLRELAKWCRKSNTAVYSALVSLEHKGYLTRDKERRFVIVPEAAQ